MPRKKAAATPQQNTELFPPIGEDIDIGGAGGGQQAPRLEDQVRALTDTVGSLHKIVEEGGKREERLLNLVATLKQPAAAGNGDQPAPAQVPQLDFSKLPDPAKDPVGFQRGVQDQLQGAVASSVRGAVDAAVKPAQAAADRKARYEALWGKFTAKHQDLADFQDLADAVAGKIVRDAGVRDPDAYIFADQDGFVDRVADAMRGRIKTINEKFGTEEDGEDGADDVVTDPRQAAPRTIGIPGAAPGSAGGGQRQSTPTTMVDELKAEQARLRIY